MGDTGWSVIILLVCIALDYLTGSWAALKNGKWSSAVARQGLWHKLGELTSLLVAALLDIALKVVLESSPAAEALSGIDLPSTACTVLVSVWYIFTELGSIIENAADLGAPIPAWLANMISKIREKTSPKEENEK